MNQTEILARFNEIACARQWSKLHTPKNLATAVAVEAAELLAEFNWLSDDDTPDARHKQKIANEIADVSIYLHVLADKLEIDIDRAIDEKMALNRTRFVKV